MNMKRSTASRDCIIGTSVVEPSLKRTRGNDVKKKMKKKLDFEGEDVTSLGPQMNVMIFMNK